MLAQRERYLHRVLKLADVSGKNVGNLESFMREPEQHGAEDHETRRLLTRQTAIERLREAEGPDSIPVLATLSPEEALQRAGELSWEELLREKAVLQAFEERLPDDARTFAEELELAPPEPGEEAPGAGKKSVRVGPTISSETRQIEVDAPPVASPAPDTQAPVPASHPGPASAATPVQAAAGLGTRPPQSAVAGEKSVRVDPTVPRETKRIKAITPPVTPAARPTVQPPTSDPMDILRDLMERRAKRGGPF